MRRLQSLMLILVLIVTLPACSWFGANAARKRLEEGSSEPVVIPEGLDQPQFVDVMPIPQVAEARELVDTNYEVGLPDALSTTFGVEQILIRKLGDERWVFVDLPPSTVWPKVLQYWETNKLTPDEIDPQNGIITSRWLVARNGTADEIFESLRSGNVFQNSTNVSSHKFRLRVEPGVRTGSTEIYLQQREIREGAPFRLDQVNWDGPSDNLELEGKVLTAVAYYLGKTISPGTISMMAGGLQRSKAELVLGKDKPVLKYQLNFGRAWATVGSALDNAKVPIEDKDRSSANYYVYYSADHKAEPGFFGKLFSSKEEKEAGPINRYTLHLAPDGDEVHVTVTKESEVKVDPLIAERLLRIVKEYST